MSSGTKLVVGLGNVGEKYKNTRHNVGFMFLDRFERVKPKNVKLLRPATMMNASGSAVKTSLEKLRLAGENLYVVHDDLDLALGEYKIQKNRGPKVHNGINSVERELGTSDFWRVRIGVDARDPENRTPGDSYVLEDFTTKEQETLEAVFTSAIGDFLKYLDE